MRILVIGGTLFIGKLLVKRLLAADHDVTAVSYTHLRLRSDPMVKPT